MRFSKSCVRCWLILCLAIGMVMMIILCRKQWTPAVENEGKTVVLLLDSYDVIKLNDDVTTELIQNLKKVFLIRESVSYFRYPIQTPKWEYCIEVYEDVNGLYIYLNQNIDSCYAVRYGKPFITTYSVSGYDMYTYIDSINHG